MRKPQRNRLREEGFYLAKIYSPKNFKIWVDDTEGK
jgi:hypothetical protein